MDLEKVERLSALAEEQRALLWEAEETIWSHPETGYKEWKTHAYMKKVLEGLGYSLKEAGNIPGFYADLDTGRPGPTLVLMAELDSVLCMSHPQADPSTGAAHACGHHAQCAALLGAAAALKTPGALDGLCGRIRLMGVPAEELLELEYREGLRKQGIIKYYGGKLEFLHRGYFDDADLCVMLHTGGGKGSFSLSPGQNGCLNKQIAYQGLAAHAGGAPHQGINALYAANLGLSAINALRETFRDEDHIRVHPIVTGQAGAVNVIPDLVTLESYVRGASLDAIREANQRVNRALAGAAAAMGARVRITDRPGYSPVYNDPNMYDLTRRVMCRLVGEDKVLVDRSWGTGCTDMGDISCVFPAIHPSGSGAEGRGHGDDYRIVDKESALTLAAKFLLAMSAALLGEGAKEAKHILDNKRTPYPSIQAYLKAVDELTADLDAVEYLQDGVRLHLS